MAAQTPKFETGRVFILYDAPWLDHYLLELVMFPQGRFDDQVDNTSQALSYIDTPTPLDNWMECARLEARRWEWLPSLGVGVTIDHLTIVRFDGLDVGVGCSDDADETRGQRRPAGCLRR